MNAHRIPGGSSSGTAVAVAANMSPSGMGSDTVDLSACQLPTVELLA